MKELTLYVCDTCGTQYKDKEKAKQCEKSHKVPISVDKANYSIKDRKSDYPLSVLVHFKDNTSARYYRK